MISGVARLGHTRARALATRRHAPPEQVRSGIIRADSIVVDQELSTETEIEQRSIRVSHAHLTLREHAPDPLNALYFAQNIVKTYCAHAVP